MPDSEEGTDGAEAAAPPPKGRKKLLVIAAAVLALLLAGGGGAWFFLLRGGSEPHGEEHAAEQEIPTAEELVDVPEMNVNLRTTDGSRKGLRVHLMLVPGEKDKEAITASLPLVIDAFQPFLRELRPDDIAGSAATFRLKEEMLIRSNAVLGKGAVKDVLIQDLMQS